MKTAAIYARVSSERQKEEQTIASQTAVLKEYADAEGYTVAAEWIFQDEGYSGSLLVRPGLERLRDLARFLFSCRTLAPSTRTRRHNYGGEITRVGKRDADRTLA